MNESFTAGEAMVKMEAGLPVFSKPGVVYQYNDISSVRGNHASYYTRYYAWDLDMALEISDKYKWFRDHKGERFYLFEWDMSPERALERMKAGDVVIQYDVIYFVTRIATYPKFDTSEEYVVTKWRDKDSYPFVQCRVSEFVDHFTNSNNFALYQVAEELTKEA